MEKLTILGFSEANISMVLDILESNEIFPIIEIINNLKLKSTKDYKNKNFNIIEKYELEGNENKFAIGPINVKQKIKISNLFSNIETDKFETLISKNAYISSTTNIGFGVVINTNVCIAAHSEIEDFVYINRGVTIGHHTKIGRYTTINPGTNIAGNVIIGENCQIGMGVNIIDGIVIGDNTVIGAGSLVTKNIESNVVAYGSPCKKIRENN
jgi:sugar O-acyltransferase (sialic acid O-acetyltransferase NeuD family)